MKKRSHRILAGLLALLILTAGLTGCSGKRTPSHANATEHSEEAAAASELQQAKTKLLDHWFEVLKVNETVYTGVFQMIEYAQAYAKDNSWDSLLKARASASAALAEIRQTEIPALELTENELWLLDGANIEVNAVTRELEETESWLANTADTVLLFYYTLEENVLMKACVEGAIPAMTAFYREYFMMEYQYVCNFTNYLLLQTDAADMWQLWSEQLPWMAACRDVWYEDASRLMDVTELLQDELKALEPEKERISGNIEYIWEITQNAIEDGDLDTLRREFNHISGVPGYFPIPYWLPDVLYLYMITDPDTQEKRLVQAGEELDEVPSTCYISCGGIPVEDAQTYEEALNQWGIEAYGKWNEAEDTWTLIAKSGSSTMLIEWTRENTVLYLSEPVGCLISELYLSAMNET